MLPYFAILQTLTRINSKTTEDNRLHWLCYGSLSNWEARKRGWLLSLPIEKLISFKRNSFAKSGNTGWKRKEFRFNCEFILLNGLLNEACFQATANVKLTKWQTSDGQGTVHLRSPAMPACTIHPALGEVFPCLQIRTNECYDRRQSASLSGHLHDKTSPA